MSTEEMMECTSRIFRGVYFHLLFIKQVEVYRKPTHSRRSYCSKFDDLIFIKCINQAVFKYEYNVQKIEIYYRSSIGLENKAFTTFTCGRSVKSE